MLISYAHRFAKNEGVITVHFNIIWLFIFIFKISNGSSNYLSNKVHKWSGRLKLGQRLKVEQVLEQEREVLRRLNVEEKVGNAPLPSIATIYT